MPQTQNKNVERLVLLIFSIYNLNMLYTSIRERWDWWITGFLAANLLLAWWLFVRRAGEYKFRALLTTACMQISLNLYASRNDQTDVWIMFLVFLVLVGLYGITEVVYITVLSSLFRYFCQVILLQQLTWKDTAMIEQETLQLIHVLLGQWLVYFWIKKRNESHQQIMQNMERLRQSEHSKDDFLANVSHEIRTPINTICGMSEMVLREKNPEKIREEVFNIQTEGRNLMSVVSDILDFSELQTGKMEIVEETYNITSTINDIIHTTLARKNEKNIEFVVDCDANLPCGMIGDEKKIRRVIMNIVNNAIKFTNEGCIRLAVSGRREEYGINLSISVSDTGIGMNEESVEKLFTSFSQVDTKRNRQEGGVGLGLAISKAIVQKMGGVITIKSKLGKGTSVTVVLPQKISDERAIVNVEKKEQIQVAVLIDVEKFGMTEIRDAYAHCLNQMIGQLDIQCQVCRNIGELKRRFEREAFTHIFISLEEYRRDREYFDALAEKTSVVVILDRQMEKELQSKSLLRIYKPFFVLPIVAVLNGTVDTGNAKAPIRQEHFIAPKAHILVVDDNAMNIQVIAGLLQPYRIQVSTATSGREALKKIENKCYDFIFMDHMMPEMDGVETLHRIRKKTGSYYQKVPVIALTANAIAGAREMFLQEGFQDFLEKPVEVSVLERVLYRNLPEEKIEPIVEKVRLPKEVSEEVRLPESLAQENSGELVIGTLCVEDGIRYNGSQRNYLKILQLHIRQESAQRKNLQDFYDQEDWENYTILVHALKSAMKGIGAQELSDLAKDLEMAGKHSDVAFIREHHEAFMEEYAAMIQMLRESPLLGTEEETKPDGTTGEPPAEDLPPITTEAFQKLRDAFEEQVYRLDGEAMMEILTKLSKYSYAGEPMPGKLTPVKRKVEMADYMSALSAFDKIQAELVERKEEGAV